MARSHLPTWLVVSVGLLAFTATHTAQTRALKQDAEALKEKVATIAAFAERPSNQGRRTTVTEPEVNAYLVYEGVAQIPAGVVEPAVTMVGGGRVTARAIVDLDAVRRQKNPTSMLDPMYFLSGRVPVTATGALRTANGVARIELESATVAGVPIPKLVLQEIVSYYSRTPENPRGIGLDEPFALPASIREILIEPGQAVVVQ
jgi:hypothetical protein